MRTLFALIIAAAGAIGFAELTFESIRSGLFGGARSGAEAATVLPLKSHTAAAALSRLKLPDAGDRASDLGDVLPFAVSSDSYVNEDSSFVIVAWMEDETDIVRGLAALGTRFDFTAVPETAGEGRIGSSDGVTGRYRHDGNFLVVVIGLNEEVVAGRFRALATLAFDTNAPLPASDEGRKLADARGN